MGSYPVQPQAFENPVIRNNNNENNDNENENNNNDNREEYQNYFNNLLQFHDVILGIVEYLHVIQSREMLEEATEVLNSLYSMMSDMLDEMSELGFPTDDWRRRISQSALVSIRAIYRMRRAFDANVNVNGA